MSVKNIPASSLCSLVFILFLTATFPVGGLSAEPETPNIVLCMTDDQGWGATSYNGHRVLKTPNLDAMAENGLRFDRFYAQHPVCSPTRGSFLTGRHPNRYRCFDWGCDLPLREVTVAEVAGQAGYRTGHFGKWHLGGIPHGPGGNNRSNLAYPEGGPEKPRHPGNQGFDEWFSHGNWFDLNPEHLYHNGERVGKVEGETSQIVMDRALQFIRTSVERERRFMAVVWFPSPHSPYRAAERFRKPYADHGKKADYYGELAAVDHAMGRLREVLRRQGVAENTLVWFCSDNGGDDPYEDTGGLRGRKGSLWEGGIRVPGLIEWPAMLEEARSTELPASTSDIYPTLVDLLDVDPEGQVKPVDGISLMPLLRGRMDQRPEPIPFEKRSRKGRFRTAALVGNTYKLHVSNLDGDVSGARLYNLKEDRKESNNVASEHPEVVRRMRRYLRKWSDSVESDFRQYPTQ